MAKIVINNVQSGYGLVDSLNLRLQQIEDEFNTKVLYRDNPVGEANFFITSDIDLNSNALLNASSVDTAQLLINGSPFDVEIQASVDAAALSASNALTSENNAASSAGASASSAAAALVSETNAAAEADAAQASATEAQNIADNLSTIPRHVVTFSGVESPVGTFTHTLQPSDIVEGAETLVVIDSLGAGQLAILRLPNESEVAEMATFDTVYLDNATGQGDARISGAVSLPKTTGGDSSLVARKFAADIWLVSVEEGEALSEAPIDGKQYARQDAAWTEVAGGSGHEVLKDWTLSTDIARDLLAGVTLGASGYEGIVLELRKMTYTGNGSGGTLPGDDNLTLALYLPGKVLMDTIRTSYGYRQSRGNQGGGNNDSNKPLLSMTSFGMYGTYVKARFSQYTGASPQWGYSLEETFMDSNSTLTGMVKGENVSSFSDATNATPTEMWLQGKAGETLEYEYRITREY